jgi:hypothetical protein
VALSAPSPRTPLVLGALALSLACAWLTHLLQLGSVCALHRIHAGRPAEPDPVSVATRAWSDRREGEQDEIEADAERCASPAGSSRRWHEATGLCCGAIITSPLSHEARGRSAWAELACSSDGIRTARGRWRCLYKKRCLWPASCASRACANIRGRGDALQRGSQVSFTSASAPTHRQAAPCRPALPLHRHLAASLRPAVVSLHLSVPHRSKQEPPAARPPFAVPVSFAPYLSSASSSAPRGSPPALPSCAPHCARARAALPSMLLRRCRRGCWRRAACSRCLQGGVAALREGRWLKRRSGCVR